MRILPPFKAQTLETLIAKNFITEDGELNLFEPTFTNHLITGKNVDKIFYSQNSVNNFYSVANLQEDIADKLEVGRNYDILAIKVIEQLRNGTQGKGTIVWIAAREKNSTTIITNIPLSSNLQPKRLLTTQQPTKFNSVVQF